MFLVPIGAVVNQTAFMTDVMTLAVTVQTEE